MIAIAVTPTVHAQTEPQSSHSMTLAQALLHARSHHPRLAVAHAEIAAREAQAEVPGARWLPRLGVTAQGVLGTNNNSASNWLGSQGAVEMPRIAGTGFLQQGSQINWAPYMTTAVAVGLDQRIFDFGRVAAERAAADARVDVSRYRADEAQLLIDLGVRESYYAVLAARGVLAASDDAVRRSTAHRDYARARVERGLRPQIELDRAEADLSRFEVGRVRAVGGLEAAQAVFAEAVGVEDRLLDAADDAPLPPPLPPLAEAIRQAGGRDPAVLVAEAELRAQRAETRALEAEMRPEVRLVATALGAAGGAPAEGRSGPAYGAGFVPWIPDYFAGVVLSWRIFDGVTRARRDVSRREEASRAAEVRAVRHDQVAAVEQAWIATDLAQRSLPALERSLDAARANYAQAEARFNAGLGTSVELADAEALRTDAEIQLALGRFQIARSRARLARVVAEGL